MVNRALRDFFRNLDILFPAIAGILFGTLQIQHSLLQGQLSFPIEYDDIIYFNDATRRLSILYDDGLSGSIIDFIQTPPHSLIATLNCFLGFLIFGVRDWAPAAFNTVYLVVFLYFVEYLVRQLGNKLNWISRIALFCVVLSCPMAGNIVIESRPDVLCGVATACAAFLLISRKKAYTEVWSTSYALAGISSSIAFLAKPSISPITTIILATAFIVPFARHNLNGNSHKDELVVSSAEMIRNKKLAKKSVKTFFLIVSASVLPYYFVSAQQISGYIYRTIFGENKEIWHVNSSLSGHLLYYITGPGGGMMFGQWYLLLALLLLISAALVILQKGWARIYSAIPYFVVIGVTYTLVTIPKTKSIFLGMSFGAQILLCAICMSAYIFRVIEVKPLSKLLKRASFILYFLIFATSVLGFEWHWHNRKGKVYELASSLRARYERNLVDSIIRQIEQDYFRVAEDVQRAPRVLLTIDMSYLTSPAVKYTFFKHGIREAEVVRKHKFRTSIDHHLALLNSSNYIIFPGLDNPDRRSWLPAETVQPDLFKALDSSPRFVLLTTFERPEYLGGGQFFLYKNTK